MACRTSDSKDDSRPDLHKDVQKHFNKFLDILLLNENVPKNILLVGRPSTGKSSFINLLKSTLTGYYDEVAQPCASYHGVMSHFTDRLNRYRNMGLNQREMNQLIEKIRSSGKNVPNNFQLPTLVDIPGLEKDSEFILDLVLDGLVPEYVNLSIPMRFGSAPVTDFTRQISNHIDHIVFVASITQDVPHQLFESIFNLAYRKKGIPFTLIITHSDCGEISSETSKARREQMESILCISKDNPGVTQCISNYCYSDPTDTERGHSYRVNLDKHKDALLAMTKMIRRRKQRNQEPEPSWVNIQLQVIFRTISRLNENMNISFKLIITGIIVLLSALVVVITNFRRSLELNSVSER